MHKLIALGGFQHETNTFAPHLAPFEAFERADSWPGLTRGAALFDVMDGLNIPLAGFIEQARRTGFALHPLCWCSAEPSSFVTRDAFERVVSILLDALPPVAELDAVYLDLHGAMVTEHYQDGEGELLRRLREYTGPDIPIVISLDLHANVTDAMLEFCDAMTIYRTYPHLDMAACGVRACELLQRLLDGEPMHKAMRKLPFLIPLTSQCTDFEPCRSIYAGLTEIEAAGAVTSIDFAAGFPPADIAECGPAVVAYGADPAATDDAVERLYRQLLEAEAVFDFELFDADPAVQRAMQYRSQRPVVLADAQDNPGAGGTSDTTGLLEALLRHGAQRTVIAVLYDPEIAATAHEAGIGAEFDGELGGKSGFAGSAPYAGRFIVEALGDGRFVYTGAMNLNSPAELGKMALLRLVDEHADVRVIVGSARAQCLDLAIFRHLGVEPTEQGILVVKSTVHFRADFDPIAAQTLVVISPGANCCEPARLSFQNLRAGVRLGPLGPRHGD